MSKDLFQTDIFSYGIEDEYEIRKKKEEEERLKKQAELVKKLEENKEMTASEKKEENTFDVNEQTTIWFYGSEHLLTDYFTIEEIKYGLPRKNKQTGEKELQKITEKQFLNRFKKDYPVLEAGADVVYVKKQNIITVMFKAKKKGLNAFKGSIEDSLKDLSNNKVPFAILRDFIAIAKHFSDQYGTEVHADVYYDYDKQSYFLDIPSQAVNTVWVELKEDNMETALKLIGKNCVKMLELHSHHIMAPIPSSTDDEGEIRSLFYAIVGNIDKVFPDITVRTYDYRKRDHIPLDPWDIFENPFETLPNTYDLSVVEVIE